MSEQLSSNKETLIEQHELFSDGKLRLTLPENPAIDPKEGWQITVDNGQELSHDEDANGIELVRSVYYALAVAKAMAESRFTPDYWANIQLNSVHGADNGVNVFGRNPNSKEAWGKPVNLRMPEERKKYESQKVDPKVAELFRKYLPFWGKEAQDLTLFPDGIKEIKPEEPEFQVEKDHWLNRPDPWQEKLIWMNEKFDLVIVQNPHLNGLHLVCHAREKYWSQFTDKGIAKMWKTPNLKEQEEPVFIQGMAESSAILLGTEKIAKELNFFNPEIHYSGNWGFKPLDPVSEQVGGREVDYQGNDVGDSKRTSEKKWESGAPNWHAHGHLYATRQAEEFVKLPSRPMKEVPEEWANIQPLTAEEEERITHAIQEQLCVWLETKMKGEKIG
ncbi:MAG: hypothetical protein US31_C0013G0017 [Berkelbacteria bacterium GW2011_GWA1_36_9]|uniref:Uncharacterized protein n=1 Tax=Berkelbacteria bacterium GW2011_GWA1_36_9 TaxID=1618331 RepID=A0A0G0I0Z6_9BACT|nr:MAG: hypothetical protein US31_C0013G0017 [Berkelbacteria bacterium GW2011_GWA1_36_9]